MYIVSIKKGTAPREYNIVDEQAWKVMKLYLEDQGILDEALAPRSTIL